MSALSGPRWFLNPCAYQGRSHGWSWCSRTVGVGILAKLPETTPGESQNAKLWGQVYKMHISYFPFPIVHSKCLCLCTQPDSSQKRMLMVLWAHVSDNRYFRLKHTHAEQSNILLCIYKSDVPRFQLSGTEFQTLIQKLSLCSDIVILCAYVFTHGYQLCVVV